MLNVIHTQGKKSTHEKSNIIHKSKAEQSWKSRCIVHTSIRCLIFGLCLFCKCCWWPNGLWWWGYCLLLFLVNFLYQIRFGATGLMVPITRNVLHKLISNEIFLQIYLFIRQHKVVLRFRTSKIHAQRQHTVHTPYTQYITENETELIVCMYMYVNALYALWLYVCESESLLKMARWQPQSNNYI